MLRGPLGPEAVEALASAVIGHVEHPRTPQIGDHGDVFVAALEGRLVDAQVPGGRRLPALQPAPDGPRLNPRRLIPAQRPPRRDRGDGRLFHPVEGQRFEERGEAAAVLRPRHPHVPRAVGRARQPGPARMHERAVLTGVEVAPDTLAMVVDRRGGLTS
jgi:hypothetical protein